MHRLGQLRPGNFSNPDPGSFLNNTYKIEQANTSADGQLNFGGEAPARHFGVRLVKAEIESTAYNLGSATPPRCPAGPGLAG